MVRANPLDNARRAHDAWDPAVQARGALTEVAVTGAMNSPRDSKETAIEGIHEGPSGFTARPCFADIDHWWCRPGRSQSAAGRGVCRQCTGCPRKVSRAARRLYRLSYAGPFLGKTGHEPLPRWVGSRL